MDLSLQQTYILLKWYVLSHSDLAWTAPLYISWPHVPAHAQVEDMLIITLSRVVPLDMKLGLFIPSALIPLFTGAIALWGEPLLQMPAEWMITEDSPHLCCGDNNSVDLADNHVVPSLDYFVEHTTYKPGPVAAPDTSKIGPTIQV